jgi:hypothetical protein
MSDALKQCRQLFAAIFEPEDVIEFRTLKQVAKRWTRADDIGSAIEELERFNAAGRHCYFGANPRTGDGGSTAEAVAACALRLRRLRRQYHGRRGQRADRSGGVA